MVAKLGELLVMRVCNNGIDRILRGMLDCFEALCVLEGTKVLVVVAAEFAH